MTAHILVTFDDGSSAEAFVTEQQAMGVIIYAERDIEWDEIRGN